MLSMHPNQSLGPEKDPGANLRVRLSAQREGGGGGAERRGGGMGSSTNFIWSSILRGVVCSDPDGL